MQCCWEHLWGCIHHIISYYSCHYICIHDILFPAHAYRIVWGDNSFGVQQRRRGGTAGDTSGVAPEGEEQTLEDFPKCPDHRPTSFLKGKPQSILSLLCFTKLQLSPFMFDALGDKSWIETTWCIELPCLDIYTFNPV